MPDNEIRPLPQPQTDASETLGDDSTAAERTRDASDHAERTARLQKEAETGGDG
jgi:hypothetical protein